MFFYSLHLILPVAENVVAGFCSTLEDKQNKERKRSKYAFLSESNCEEGIICPLSVCNFKTILFEMIIIYFLDFQILNH